METKMLIQVHSHYPRACYPVAPSYFATLQDSTGKVVYTSTKKDTLGQAKKLAHKHAERQGWIVAYMPHEIR